jgi:hypothetical protein
VTSWQDPINAEARSRGYVPAACRANADRHAADLVPIIARLDPDGSLSPSHPCPYFIESLTVRPRRSTCNSHPGHSAIRR